MITAEYLRSAGATISDMSGDEVDRRLRQLKDERRSRGPLAEVRQQAELDIAELEQAAYLLARRYHDDGDLTAAARWYRVAAANDYADACLELAKVLGQLAGLSLDAPPSHLSGREELDLVSQAARWYGAAYAAGYPESAELLDELITRHDPGRERGDRHGAGERAAAPAASGGCPIGGLAVVMHCQLTTATAHVGSCQSCLAELLDCGGIWPVSRQAR